MSDEYKIETVMDILARTPEQRERCVADLLSWCRFCDLIPKDEVLGLLEPEPYMVWVDDDRIGQVSGVTLLDKETGQELSRVKL